MVRGDRTPAELMQHLGNNNPGASVISPASAPAWHRSGLRTQELQRYALALGHYDERIPGGMGNSLTNLRL